MNLSAFTGEVLERLRADMQSIRNPEGDVHPALFLNFGRSDLIRRHKIPFAAFSDRQTKDVLAAGIAQATVIARPKMLAFEFTAWLTERQITPEVRAAIERSKLPAGMVAPSKDPERVEAVLVVSFDREHSENHRSVITRDGRNPPVFAPWEPLADEVGGLVLEPLMRAMHS